MQAIDDSLSAMALESMEELVFRANISIHILWVAGEVGVGEWSGEP
jgi:hypothetical protein